MSPSGQAPIPIMIGTSAMVQGKTFDRHVHDEHQPA